jgi:hypothetical protein
MTKEIKKNWCIHAPSLLEYESLTLANWFFAKYKLKITEDYAGFINGIPASSNLMYSQVPCIDFKQFYKNTISNQDDYEKIHNSLFCYREELVKLEEKLTTIINDKFNVLSFVKQNENIEERLTKLIEEKFGNTKQPQELPQEKKPIWETHPDWESCKTYRNRWYVDNIDQVDTLNLPLGIAKPFSEAHAKRQVAEIKLMEIAEKWNDGTNVLNSGVMNLSQCTVNFKYLGRGELFVTQISTTETFLFPIRFKTIELAQKSIELHKELWMNYFCISE